MRGVLPRHTESTHASRRAIRPVRSHPDDFFCSDDELGENFSGGRRSANKLRRIGHVIQVMVYLNTKAHHDSA